MPALFSTNKSEISLLLITLCLSLTSLPLAQSKPSGRSLPRLLQDDSDTSGDCWITSYGRGVGKVISTCPNNLENDASLCYTPCKEGFTGDGPVCWQNCPDGFTNTGGECLKPSSYGRGSGYASWHEQECEDDNPQGCDWYGAMYYPKCKEGFYAYGCCVCSPNCINGMTDIGVSCQKQSYGRGAGKALVCKNNEEEDAGLCYPPCRGGYDGIGPVCWGQCPAGKYQCGALCVKDEATCVDDILKVAKEVFKLIGEAAEAAEDGDLLDFAKDSISDIGKLASIPVCNN